MLPMLCLSQFSKWFCQPSLLRLVWDPFLVPRLSGTLSVCPEQVDCGTAAQDPVHLVSRALAEVFGWIKHQH